MYYTKTKNKEYFNFKNFIKDKPNSQYYLIIGQRSNGKSYSTMKYLIDEYFKKGKEFMYLRRYDENVKTKIMSNVLGELEEYIRVEYNHNVRFYNGSWLVSPCEEELKIKNSKVMGRAFSLTSTEKMKSTSYPNTHYIIFEEFIATMGYISDEVNLLMNIISTVFRDRENGKIILLGNSISKTNPYTESLGVSLKDFPQGGTKDFHSITGGISTTVTLHRCKRDVKVKKVTVKTGYTSFGKTDFGVMIHNGEFEVRNGLRHIGGNTFKELFNHIPKSFKASDEFIATPICVRYLDVTYRFYLYRNEHNVIGGFKRCEITEKIKVLISPNINDYGRKYKLVTNMNYISNLSVESGMYKLLSYYNDVMSTGMFITFNDDENEDIIKVYESVQ